MEHNYTQECKVKNWTVCISPSTNYGYFQDEITETEGGLWFKGRMLIEYDGVFQLPINVVKALKKLRKTFDRNTLPLMQCHDCGEIYEYNEKTCPCK